MSDTLCQFVAVSRNLPSKYRCVHCGFTTPRAFDRPPGRLTRRCDDPTGTVQTGIVDRVTRYASAAQAWEAAGKPVRSDGDVDRIADVCRGCEFYRDGRCKVCGCNVRGTAEERDAIAAKIIGPALTNKIRMSTEDCPIRCDKCHYSKWDCACKSADKMFPRNGPLRVAIPTFGIFVGGIDYWIRTLIANADPSEVQFAIAADTCNAPLVAEQLRQYATVTFGKGAARHAISQADAVLCWAMNDPSLLQMCPGPRIFVAHGLCEWTEHFAEKMTPHVSHFAAVSKDAATVFLGGKVAVIHNVADMERVQPRRDRTEVRRELGLKDEDIAVAYIGRLAEEKNPFAVVEACEHLGRPFVPLVVGPCYSNIVAMQKRSFEGRAIFHGGFDHVGDILGAVDCVVIASPAEGGPLIALEAMAAGVPLATTRVGVVRDLEDDNGEPIAATLPPEEFSIGYLANRIALATSPAWKEVVDRAKVVATYTTPRMFADQWVRFINDAAWESSRLHLAR